MNIIFETERLFVRPYTMDDLDLFYRLNGDEEVMRYIRPAQTKAKSKDFLKKIIKEYSEQPGLGRWAMLRKADQEFVGSFAVIPIVNSGRIQLGYALLKEYWGSGYASESVKEGLNYAFCQYGLKEIAGITEAANVISQKVLLKNGFVFESSFREEKKEMNLYNCKRQFVNG